MCSAFTAELMAVFSAVRYIFFNFSHCANLVLFTDSKSLLSSLGQLFPSNQLVQDIQDWIFLLASRKGIKLEFCWVPSHVGIVGNERADVAAKDAIRLDHCSGMGIPISDFRNVIRCYCRDQWQNHWSSLTSNFKLRSIRPSVHSWHHCQMNRRSEVILTRLRIGHTYFTHKYLMTSGAERQVPQCPSCHTDITVKHFLVDCPEFLNNRRTCLLANKSLSEILGEHAPVGQIVEFLKKVHLFYEI